MRWSEYKNIVGYDSTDDLDKREKQRAEFLTSLGYEPNDEMGLKKLDEFGAYDKEKAFKKQVSVENKTPVGGIYTEGLKSLGLPEGIARSVGTVMQAVGENPITRVGTSGRSSQQTPLGVIDEATGVPVKYLNAEDAYDWYNRVNAGNLGDFGAGMRESVAAVERLKELNPEARKAVVDRINAESAARNKAIEERGIGSEIASRTLEGAGNVLGSPSAYLAPIIPLASIPGMASFGGVQGAENTYAQKALGRDVDYLSEVAKGSIGGLMGGALASRALPKMPSKVAIPAAPFIVGAPQAAIEAGANTQGEGIVEKAKDFGRKFLVAEGASAATAIPQATLAYRSIEKPSRTLPPSAVEDSVVRAGYDRGAAESIVKSLEQQRINKAEGQLSLFPEEDLRAVKEFLSKPREAKEFVMMDEDPSWKEVASSLFLSAKEAVVDPQSRVLSRLNEQRIKEATDAYGDMQTYLDAMQKDSSKIVPAERAINKILSEQGDNQKANSFANEALENIMLDENGKLMSKERRQQLEIYASQRNIVNTFLRSAENGKQYILPTNLGSLEDMLSNIQYIESTDPFLVDKANKIFELNSQALDTLKNEAGIISQDQYDRLKSVGDNLGIVHKLPYSKWEGIKRKFTKSASSRDIIDFLGSGASLPVDTNVLETTYRRLRDAKQAMYKNQRMGALLDVALKDPENGIISIMTPGEETRVGNVKLTYKNQGEDVELQVPGWFKDSLEKTPIGQNSQLASGLLGVAGWLTGTAPIRKIAVEYNPSFAIVNTFILDMMRGYRYWAVEENRGGSFVSKYLKQNPAAYLGKWGASMASVIPDVLKRGPLYQEARDMGALSSRVTRDRSADWRYSESKVGKVLSMLSKPGSISEDVSRVAAYKRLKDRGFDQERAGQRAGGYINYHRKGIVLPLVDSILAPFANVPVQAARAEYKAIQSNPKDYAARAAWIALGGLAYGALRSNEEYELDKTLSEQRRASGIQLSTGDVDEKGNPFFAQIPLEQGSRPIVQLGKQVGNIVRGRPVEWKEFGQSILDNLPFIQNLTIPPSVRAIGAVKGWISKDPTTGRPLNFGREAEEGNRHLVYDPQYDSKPAKIMSDILYYLKIADVEPGKLEYAGRQMFVTGLLTDLGTAGASYGTSEGDATKLPVAKRFFVKGNIETPFREETKDMRRESNADKIAESAFYRDASRIKDSGDFTNFVMTKAMSSEDPRKYMQYLRDGLRDRAMGVDTRFEGYLRQNLEPEYYEKARQIYIDKTGREGTIDKALLRKGLKANALGGANYGGNSQ